MNGQLAITLALIALGSPILVYLGIVRRLSGKVRTSDAGQLWEESAKMRLEYREEIKALRATVLELQGRINGVERRNEDLYRENVELRHEISELRAENKMLHKRIGELEANGD